jgi:hypothetical protein
MQEFADQNQISDDELEKEAIAHIETVCSYTKLGSSEQYYYKQMFKAGAKIMIKYDLKKELIKFKKVLDEWNLTIPNDMYSISIDEYLKTL